MPGFNQTGPLGNGTGGGRGVGPCGGGKRHRGTAGSQGMGRTRLGAGQALNVDERTALTQEAETLERALSDVRKRLDKLNKVE